MSASGLLRLLQLSDSSFPTGGYSLSHGLEGLHAMGWIKGEADVRDVALTHIEESLAQQDLPAVSNAHLYASGVDLNAIVALDELLRVLKPVPSFRNASMRVGRRMMESAQPLYSSLIADRYLHAIRNGATDGHHAVAFGVVTCAAGSTTGCAAGIERADAVTAFAASSLNSYVAAAVRLGVIGQRAAQRIIATLEPALMAAIAMAPLVALEDLGGYMPLIDIAGMRQPALAARMFAS
jgi:urease accessory protein